MAAYDRRATGEKVLINPSKPLDFRIICLVCPAELKRSPEPVDWIRERVVDGLADFQTRRRAMTNEPHAEHQGARRTTASTTGSPSTRAFLQNAVAFNCYEIEAAQMALARCSDEAMRAFAQQTLTEHQALGARIRHTLADLGEQGEIDEKLDTRRKGMLANLRDTPPAAFAPRYLDQQLTLHREAATLFRGYAGRGDHPQVKALAADALPMLERRLDQAVRLRGR